MKAHDMSSQLQNPESPLKTCDKNTAYTKPTFLNVHTITISILWQWVYIFHPAYIILSESE